jgi:hypothetical protein
LAGSYPFSGVSKVGEEIAMSDVLQYQHHWLLDGDTAKHVDYKLLVVVVGSRHLLYHLNLLQEVCLVCPINIVCLVISEKNKSMEHNTISSMKTLTDI